MPCEYIEELVFFLTEKQKDWRFGFPVLPCGLGARDTLRLEAAMPLYGHELSESMDPFQAGLDWAVKLNKPKFIGQEALRKLDAQRTLTRVGLILEGRKAARDKHTIYVGAQEIGFTTSGSFSPTLQKSIAMGYIQPSLHTPDALIEIDIRGSRIPTQIVPLPFYRRTR